MSERDGKDAREREQEFHELSDEKGKENYHSVFGRYNFEVTPMLNH